MDKKQLTMAIIILSATFLLLIGGLLTVYFINPSLVGLEPKNLIKKNNEKHIIDQLNQTGIEPTVLISLERAIELDNIEKDNIKLDSTIKIKEGRIVGLVDSLSSIYSKKISFKDTVSVINQKFNRLLANNKILNDSLNKIIRDYDKDRQRMALLENRIKSQEDFIVKQQDSLEIKNFADFAKMYNGVAPKDVARILEQIDERDAARILKMMSSRKAGKVLESMTAEKSAAILLLGAVK